MKRFLVAILMIASLSGAVMHATTPTAAAECNARFLTLPAWYNGAVADDNCNLVSPSELGGDENTQLTRYISIIALNVIEIALQAVAYITIGFLIYGGFIYLTSGGDSGRVTSGRKIILNAIVGLVLSIFSAAIVGFIASNLG